MWIFLKADGVFHKTESAKTFYPDWGANDGGRMVGMTATDGGRITEIDEGRERATDGGPGGDVQWPRWIVGRRVARRIMEDGMPGAAAERL